jgi:hypothetical protein
MRRVDSFCFGPQVGADSELTMNVLAISTVVGLLAVSAAGQSGVAEQARQRAVRLNEQNNVRQGVSAPAVPQTNLPPVTRPDPVLAATLQNIANLQRDLAGLQTDPARKQPLLNDLAAAALGTRPSNRALAKLAADLATALQGKHLSPDQLKKLAQNTRAICNSSHLSEKQRQTIFEEVQRILQDGGVPADDAAKVANDFKTIAAETQ